MRISTASTVDMPKETTKISENIALERITSQNKIGFFSRYLGCLRIVFVVDHFFCVFVNSNLVLEMCITSETCLFLSKTKHSHFQQFKVAPVEVHAWNRHGSHIVFTVIRLVGVNGPWLRQKLRISVLIKTGPGRKKLSLQQHNRCHFVPFVMNIGQSVEFRYSRTTTNSRHSPLVTQARFPPILGSPVLLHLLFMQITTLAGMQHGEKMAEFVGPQKINY